MALAKGTIAKIESVQSPTHSQAKNFSVRMRITGQSHYFIKCDPKEIGRREREVGLVMRGFSFTGPTKSRLSPFQ
jgi:hypothetical protein